MTDIVKTPSPQGRAELAIHAGTLKPANMGDLWRLSDGIFKSGIVPKGAKTVEMVFVALAAGMEVGLTPMQALKNVMVVNGTPAIWGDAALGLIMASGQLEDIKETIEGCNTKDELTDASFARCIVKRKGIATQKQSDFSVADAKKAGLWGKAGPWTQYPKRMLKYRARAFALRDLFADKLCGLGIAEEVEDYGQTGAARAESVQNIIENVDKPATELPAAPTAHGREEMPPAEQVSEDGQAFLDSMAKG